jgi:hypothetical protein
LTGRKEKMMKPGEDEIETTQMETIKTTTGGGVRPSADECVVNLIQINFLHLLNSLNPINTFN